jgi:hypothetical protein
VGSKAPKVLLEQYSTDISSKIGNYHYPVCLISATSNYLDKSGTEIETESPYYYFFNSTNDYQCTQDKNCPNEYSKLVKDRNECINDCNNDTSYIYEFKDICYKNCPPGTKLKNNNICEEVLICTNEVFYIIIETGECSNNCTALNFFNNICKINSDDPRAKDEMINTIRGDLLRGEINPLLIPKFLNQMKI